MAARSADTGFRRRGPWFRPVALGCAMSAVLAGCGVQADTPPSAFDEDAVVAHDAGAEPRADEPGSGTQASTTGADRPAAPDAADASPEPRPVAVEIPSIGVHAELVPLGLNDDRSMEVPDFGLAGWYAKGPRPGADGPAVIVAHFDSTEGPDVFYELAALTAGDEIRVHRDDGSVAAFTVGHLEQHPKEELPGDRIWSPSDEPRLTLITCGGVFDRSTGHYTDNVLAYATSAEP